MKQSKEFHPYRYMISIMRKLIKDPKKLEVLLRIRMKAQLIAWKTQHYIFHLFRREKKLCVIYIGDTKGGFFSCFIKILAGLSYAYRHELTPVVDMKNYPNPYLEDEELGRINSWEYYFKQPCDVSLEEALATPGTASRCIRLYAGPRVGHALFQNLDGELDYWRNICNKYIRVSDEVQKEIDHFKTNFKGRKVLGVSLRGTDYISLKLHDHPVQPTPEEVIVKAEEVMKEYSFDAVYLSTEDKNIVAKFQAAFGDKLLLHEEVYVDYDYNANKWVTHYSTHREHDKYLMGFEYIVSKLLLLECQGLITNMACGTTSIMCISKGWEYLHVFDLGYYD